MLAMTATSMIDSVGKFAAALDDLRRKQLGAFELWLDGALGKNPDTVQKEIAERIAGARKQLADDFINSRAPALIAEIKPEAKVDIIQQLRSFAAQADPIRHFDPASHADDHWRPGVLRPMLGAAVGAITGLLLFLLQAGAPVPAGTPAAQPPAAQPVPAPTEQPATEQATSAPPQSEKPASKPATPGAAPSSPQALDRELKVDAERWAVLAAGLATRSGTGPSTDPKLDHVRSIILARRDRSEPGESILTIVEQELNLPTGPRTDGETKVPTEFIWEARHADLYEPFGLIKAGDMVEVKVPPQMTTDARGIQTVFQKGTVVRKR
jgi:hypothetical protein